MLKGISSGSSERLDDEFRLHSSLPLCFFAGFVDSAVEVAGFDEEEEDEEEDDEEESSAFRDRLIFRTRSWA